MGLNEKTSGITYVNIKNGVLIVGKGEDKKSYGSMEGVIEKVDFSEEEFDGRKFEKAKIFLRDGADLYALQMRTDSGYFRTFCNSLRTAKNFKSYIKIIPKAEVQASGMTKTWVYVNENGSEESLRHYYSKDFNGLNNEYPELKKVEFRGQVAYDNIEQIKFWKKFLIDTYNPRVVSAPPAAVSQSEEESDGIPPEFIDGEEAPF